MRIKTILITGSSSGFGKTAVRLLLERGHNVIAAMRGGRARLESLFPEELRRHSGRLHAVELHLEKPDSFAEVTRTLEQNFDGKLDVLVNNAGYGLFGPLEDMTEDQLRLQMEVNFFGPVLLARRLIPLLRRSKGRIINISSIAGMFTVPFYGPYCASKFALEAMSEAMHYELRSQGIEVTLIEPGGFRTEFMSAKVFSEKSLQPASLYHGPVQRLRWLLEKSTPRLGNPARVARLIVRRCEQERVPLRTLIGTDAWGMRLLQRLLPDSWRVGLIGAVSRRLIFSNHARPN
jgi:NAD(P)-dependent dehydrogenase (short-subunit alcohol dehydrogenase family)